MPKISNTAAVLIIVLTVIILLIIGGCKLSCNKQKDGYTRTPLSGESNCRFVRTPVDYAMQQQPYSKEATGFHRNPHWVANPKDELQPLEFGPVDFWPDLRRMQKGTLFDQYGNDYVGGTGKPTYFVNDQKTRSLLTEVGDLGIRRALDNIPAAGWPHTGTPAWTEATDMVNMSNPEFDPKYGGSGYFKFNPGT